MGRQLFHYMTLTCIYFKSTYTIPSYYARTYSTNISYFGIFVQSDANVLPAISQGRKPK